MFVPQVQPHPRHCHLPAEAAEGRPRQEALQENGCSKVLKCRGIIVYIEYLSVCPFVGISSAPPPRKRVCLPPWTHRVEQQHSLAGKGLGGHNYDYIGQKAWPFYGSLVERFTKVIPDS